MSLDLSDVIFARDIVPPPPRWRPCCPVCGDVLGRRVVLDVLSHRRGGRFRLTCTQLDRAHAVGVSRHYFLSAEHEPRQTLEHLALKGWADPGKLAAAVIEWLLAHRLIQPVPPRAERKEP